MEKTSPFRFDGNEFQFKFRQMNAFMQIRKREGKIFEMKIKEVKQVNHMSSVPHTFVLLFTKTKNMKFFRSPFSFPSLLIQFICFPRLENANGII